MELNIVIPSQRLTQVHNVQSITVDTPEGSHGILPNRRDCIAPLKPGILIYRDITGQSHYVAVDHGLMVKRGGAVTVSVRRAVCSDNLEALSQLVKDEYLNLNQKEQALQQALDKLESRLMQNLVELSQ